MPIDVDELDEAGLRRLMNERDEGEQLEFKRGRIDDKAIAEYAVGIGNEGGGWLLMGITDRRPRGIVGVARTTERDLQRLRDSLFDSTGIRVGVRVVSTSEGSVLAIRIPGRPKGQVFHTKSGKYLRRSGEGLRGMAFEEIDRIRGEEIGDRDWSADVVDEGWQGLIDPLELERLRRILRDQQKGEIAKLGDEALLRSLQLLVPSPRRLLATRAAILLVGREEAIRAHAPNHEVKLQRFDRDELNPALSEDLRAGLLAVVQRAAEIIQTVNTAEMFQAGLFRVEVPKFPERAYREAIVNAMCHRDYGRRGNVAIRIHGQRIEVGSPGGWYGGVSESNILVTESQRRNEALAQALQRMGLAERSALGVKRMFSDMLLVGKKAPEYRSTSTSVTVVLLDGSFDRAFAALARKLTESGTELAVFDLLLLSHLRVHREISANDAAVLCQTTLADARRLLDQLRNRRLVDRDGTGRARRYVLGPVAYEGLGLVGERPRDLGMDARTFEGLLIDELARSGGIGLTAREIREWSRYGRAQTTRLLGDLAQRGAIAFSGKRGRGARYWHPGHAPNRGRSQ